MRKVRAVRLSDETWERLSRQATERGISVSERIRELVDTDGPRADFEPPTETAATAGEYRSRPFTPVPKPTTRRK